jgi:hypothetical protein
LRPEIFKEQLYQYSSYRNAANLEINIERACIKNRQSSTVAEKGEIVSANIFSLSNE